MRGLVLITAFAAALVLLSGRLLAQDPAPRPMQHDMAAMAAHSPLGLPQSRMGSGTSWLPDSSSFRAATAIWGRWMISLQGAVFGQYVDQSTKRGDQQLGITDWEMMMATRPLGDGFLHVHAMTSVEPFVLGGAGYPELLQNGGTYRHAPIHDRQHPHDALMELSSTYENSLTDDLAFSVYAGAVGEPALGPVAFMHRPSAENDPFAPIGHHWQDNTHQSFGVLTLGFNTRTLKIEGSLFNPREADENHLIVDYRDARLDAYAGRLSWAPTARIVASAWMGFLNAHERLDPTGRMHRYGVSIITSSRGPGRGRMSGTLLWGMNLHHHGSASHALVHGDPGASPHHKSSSWLAESNLEVGSRGAVFARVEQVQKNGAEFGFSGGDLTTLYDVRSIAAGGTYRIVAVGNAELSLGARAAVNFVPQALLANYGTRTPTGFAVYARLRVIPSETSSSRAR